MGMLNERGLLGVPNLRTIEGAGLVLPQDALHPHAEQDDVSPEFHGLHDTTIGRLLRGADQIAEPEPVLMRHPDDRSALSEKVGKESDDNSFEMLQEAKCLRATSRACGSTVGGRPARTEFAGDNVNSSLVVRAFVEQAKGSNRVSDQYTWWCGIVLEQRW